MKSIALLFPYFGGAFPTQFKIWWASALENHTIDFLIFTDADIKGEKNIKVIQMSFENFKDIIQSAFDFKISLNRPYKLCEYKQTYGYVLQNYIKDYDFWGLGDMDLVYGNIRHFLTEDILSSYKFFLGWGHLSLFRNDDDTNKYFMTKIAGYQYYKDAFTTNTITFFDEFDHKGCSDKWKDNRGKDCWLEVPFDNVSKPKQAFHFNSLSRGWKQVVFEYDKGQLYMIRFIKGKMERKESLYAHFQHRGYMKDKITDYSHFLVIPTGMIDYPKSHAAFWIRLYCLNLSIITKYYQWKDRIIYKLGLSYNR